MCIAIFKPEDKLIDKATLQRCYDANPDGAGFMFANNKELHVKKGFFSFNSFWKAYKVHEHKKAVIHFRIKTHGKIDKTNCHPFLINNSLGFVHNGIISGFGDDKFSDTIGFNKEILQPLVAKWGNLALFDDPVTDLIEGRIGYSKLIFLDRHNNHKIMNEQKGEWSDGVWYSNTSYKPYVAPTIDKSYKNSWSKNMWDYYTAPSKTKSNVTKVGDVVELTKEIKDDVTNSVFEAGELAEIVKINSDFTFDLMLEDDGPGDKAVFLYNVPKSDVELYAEYEDDFVPTWLTKSPYGGI